MLLAVDPATPAPAPAEERPPAVPRPSAAGVPSPPDEPATAPNFVTYLPLPPATPPTDTAALEESHLPAPGEAPPPEPAAAPPPPETAAPPQKPPKPPKPPKRRERAPATPQLPKPPREPLSGGLLAAIAITVVLLVGGGIAALVLSGGDDKPKAATAAPTRSPTATPSPPPSKRAQPGLGRQVQTLDALMKTSQQGRAAAAKGDTKAAIANRAKLLSDLRRLRGQATDTRLKAGLGSFVAAIRESLRQNRECGAACPAKDLNKVNRLKQDTVTALNPLLRKYAKTSYRARDI